MISDTVTVPYNQLFPFCPNSCHCETEWKNYMKNISLQSLHSDQNINNIDKRNSITILNHQFQEKRD